MTADRRVFLGWDGPMLPRAALWLLNTLGPDLSNHILFTPGGRAGRLLQTALVEAIRDRGQALSPPLFKVATDLGALFDFATPPAGPVARRLAWRIALREAGTPALEALLRHPPRLDDAPSLARVARLLETWTADLAAAAYRLDEIEAAATAPGAALPDFADAPRWRAAGDLQRRYEHALAARHLHDPDLAVLDAVRDPGSIPMRSLKPVLIGVSELPQVARLLLSRHDNATFLVAAPDTEADRFDPLGCILPDRWGDADTALPVPIPDARFLVADTPADQADLALAAIASLNGAYAAEDIIIGVPDPDVAPRLATAGRRVGPGAGVEFRPAAGRPLNQTPPVTLVRAIRDYLGNQSFQSLAALVRHPDAERWIARHLDHARADHDEPRGASPRPSPPPVEHWLGLMDRFASQGLPDSAQGHWRVPITAHRVILESVRDAVDTLLAPLTNQSARTPADLSRALLESLAAVYQHRRLTLGNPVHDLTISACDALRDAAHDLARAPADPATPVSAPDALTLILDALDDKSLAGHPSRDSIEMLGWLELALDPAPVAIITGFNEGSVPAAPPQQPLLPEPLRRALGLSTSRSRLARDAYLMTVITNSRPHLWIIAGRHGPDGDPTPPSRLLFLCDDHTAANRLRVFTGLSPTPAPARVRRRVMGSTAAAFECMPIIDAPLPDSLSVTAFARYLRCPYEFYLREILDAGEVEEPEPEMSPRLFGSLIHDTMAQLAGADAASSDDPAVVAQALSDLLSTIALDRVGPRPRAAVRLQVHVARQRLQLLARHQAEWAAKGWRILLAERGARPGEARLIVDGSPMGLHGRIDRIDRHPDGRLAVLDYKTGDKPGDPDRTHRKGRGDNKSWKDLQLPLYRHLLPAILGDDAPSPRRSFGRGGEGRGEGQEEPWIMALRTPLTLPSPRSSEQGRVEGADSAPGTFPPVDDARITLGYICIGAAEEHIGFCEAEWTPADLAQADNAAHDVIRAIRRRDFRKADPVPDHRVIRALCEGASP